MRRSQTRSVWSKPSNSTTRRSGFSRSSSRRCDQPLVRRWQTPWTRLACSAVRSTNNSQRSTARKAKLLDLVGDPTLPQDSIRKRLRDVVRTREKLHEQYTNTSDDLADGAAYIEAHLRLLEDPYELYLNASDELRRSLNQLIFVRIYVVNDQVVGDELRSPLAELLDAQRGFLQLSRSKISAEEMKKAVGAANGLRALANLARTYADGFSSSTLLVDLRGLEPLTPCMPCRCATSCATDPYAAKRGPTSVHGRVPTPPVSEPARVPPAGVRCDRSIAPPGPSC